MVLEDLYSVFTFDPIYNFHSGMPILLKTCLVQYWSPDETPSHSWGPSGKFEWLNSVRPPLLKAFNGVLAYVEKKYLVSGLHLDFAKKERTAQLNGMFTGEELQKMMERRNCYSADTVPPLVAAFIDRGFGVEERCDFTRVIVMYTEMVKNALRSKRQ